ncbi:hypothetical protein A5634_13700 [Mycobacterium asiaticum]|uniref:Uncharacterized protein n=1 Tax=Mycobacterium asiaticum TaxID=1790 RepID=A0A1A3PEA5_MYCAS|nr:hypothetical protein A5634_13700 [Mycobacterium asiaticum]
MGLMAMESDLLADRVLLGPCPKDLDRIRVQELAFNQFADRSARLERRVQRKPGLRPQETVGDLFFDFAADLVVLGFQEALDEVLVVAQNLVEYTERIHAAAPLPSASSTKQT